ncbi:MAG: putative polyketide biosynthesis zinc-dependent hydrolase BaeB [Bacteroidota bacterium]|jgi:glyoxylase-like metal-dependent hydrolase (beta-lactamase superfamily II)/rhodanese-related sulfurtransferase
MEGLEGWKGTPKITTFMLTKATPMSVKIDQIYTGCLAQGAYYIQSGNEAAIIDPLREIRPYIERAEKNGATIKYIFETHFHADFVSGHLDLSKKTGAPIVYGPTANPSFDAHIAKDGEVFRLGDVTIKVLHTPGHTMESSCYLLSDENGKEHSIFTGDTLFLGDVGRPDLAQKAAHMTQEDLAGLLYDSLTTKILPLPDSITVYPAHGAGSACGKNMSKETVDTLGNQKKQNYALNQPDRTSFIQAVTEGLTPPPAYFPLNVAMNKQGYDSIDSVVNNGLRGLDPDSFEQAAESSEALILDTRSAGEFTKGFVPRSINIGLDGQFAPWVGALIADVRQPLLLVTDPGKEEESVIRLARVGFDNVLGHLKGGFESWKNSGKETDTIHRITAKEFEGQRLSGDQVLDVRRDSEYGNGHVPGARNLPLDYITEWWGNLDTNRHFFLHCQGGYRSMIAASILKSRGIHDFSEVEGGFKAISETGVPIEKSQVKA